MILRVLFLRSSRVTRRVNASRRDETPSTTKAPSVKSRTFNRASCDTSSPRGSLKTTIVPHNDANGKRSVSSVAAVSVIFHVKSFDSLSSRLSSVVIVVRRRVFSEYSRIARGKKENKRVRPGFPIDFAETREQARRNELANRAREYADTIEGERSPENIPA